MWTPPLRSVRQFPVRGVSVVGGVGALGAWTWLYAWVQVLVGLRFGWESFAWGIGVAALGGLVAGAFAVAGLVHQFKTRSRLDAAALLATAVLVAPVLAALIWIAHWPLIAVVLPAVAVAALLELGATPRHLLSVSSLLFVGLTMSLTVVLICTLLGGLFWLVLNFR